MAVWSVITTSEIELHRIDAEFYQPHYLQVRHLAGEKKLRHYGVHVEHPAEVKRDYAEIGLSAVLAQNNRDNFYDWSVRKFFPKSLSPIISRNGLYNGDVTITRTGANYGQTSVVKNELAGEQLYACADLLILRTSEQLGALISTYLNTRVGKLLMLRGAYGAAQPHIAPSYIYEIPMPQYLIPHSEEIDSYIAKSRKCQSDADNLWQQAQSLLESELGLDKLTFEKPVSYAARFSEVAASHRLDAQHFYPYFDAITASLPNGVKLEPLSKFLVACARGKQPAYSDSSQAKVVNSRHVLVNKVVLDDNRYAILQRDVIRPRAGDVLMNGTGVGTIGRAAPLMSEEPVVLDNHVTLLRVQGIDPVFLSVYLNSAIGQAQVEKHLRGSSGQIELYPADIRKFLVWNAPEELQKKIRNLIESALTAEQESKHLLEQAKHRVEALIEEAIAA